VCVCVCGGGGGVLSSSLCCACCVLPHIPSLVHIPYSSTNRLPPPPSLPRSIFLLDLLAAVDVRAVNTELVTPGESVEDRMKNAKYVLSVARKVRLGASFRATRAERWLPQATHSLYHMCTATRLALLCS
jgi:hypothetical protein